MHVFALSVLGEKASCECAMRTHLYACFSFPRVVSTGECVRVSLQDLGVETVNFFIYFVLIWVGEFNSLGWSLLSSSGCVRTPTEELTLTVKLLTSCSVEAASGCLLSGTSTAVRRKVKFVGGEATKQELPPSDWLSHDEEKYRNSECMLNLRTLWRI